MNPSNPTPSATEVQIADINADVEKTRIMTESQREQAWLAVDAERIRVLGHIIVHCDALCGMTSDQRFAILSALTPPVANSPLQCGIKREEHDRCDRTAAKRRRSDSAGV
jgi:hypothetical protein